MDLGQLVTVGSVMTRNSLNEGALDDATWGKQGKGGGQARGTCVKTFRISGNPSVEYRKNSLYYYIRLCGSQKS